METDGMMVSNQELTLLQRPIYQLFDKELWEDFTFKERYAGWQELRRYFQHIEKKWHVSDHVTFNKHVDGAVFDEKKHMWLVDCSDGSEIYCRWFIPCSKCNHPVRAKSSWRRLIVRDLAF